MTRILDVYLDHAHVGTLTQNQGGRIVFAYTSAWLERADAIPLSWSLPLRPLPFPQKECRGFFAGILPEESNRDVIAKILGISARNDYAMLEQIGGECAGAVTFVPEGEKLPFLHQSYWRPTDSGFANLLRQLPNRPLLVGEHGLRLSLAGAQSKIAVHINADGQMSLSTGNAPSTHILKPANSRFRNMVLNEYLCLNLARRVGIPVAEVALGRIEDIEYLLVRRYDRFLDTERLKLLPESYMSIASCTYRLHQEDFCQALSIPPEQKYQGEGGPGLRECFALLRNASSFPAIDLQHLLDMVLFNVIVGNHDAHGKNFSLLYNSGTSNSLLAGLNTRLAPAYDILSTVYYPELTSRMAMKIGKQYESAKLRRTDIEVFAKEAGLGVAAVRKRLLELSEAIKTNLPELREMYPSIDDLITLIAERANWVQRLAQ
ncbi:MAG: type II toxin-antitoxin system HipA family toxin [Holosporales bacterium]|jgi:serine/threonine-protein kinase HipA